MMPGLRLAFIKKRFSFHGGGERYLQTLVGQLGKEGHEVHVFAENWSEEKGIRFHRVKGSRRGSFSSVLAFNRNAGRALRSRDAFHCVVSFERTTCQDIYRAGEGCHAEWLRKRSAVEPLYKRLSFRVNPLHISLLRLEREIFDRTKVLIANSRMVKDEIVRHYGVSPGKITVLYNGVDVRRFSPENRALWRERMRKELRIPDSTAVVLFVGTGFARKGLGALVEAMGLLKSDDLCLWVVGRGGAAPYLGKAENAGVKDRIHFLGPREGIERYYAAADLFVLPTLYDPGSNATMEALAAGLPVITTTGNGVAELISDGEEGYAVEDPLDARRLADRMRACLGSREAMGRKAVEVARRYTIEASAREFIALINKVGENGAG